MIKRVILILLFISISISYSQNIPKLFKFNNKNSSAASGNSTPGGNSITDILTIGDTIWVGFRKRIERIGE